MIQMLIVGYCYGIIRANHLDGYSHLLFDAALQVHRWLDAESATVPLPPDEGTSVEVGDTSNWHSAAACVTDARWPFTTIAPLRAIGSGLRAALNWTVPSPCPLAAPATVSHPASGAAVHWHSRSVLTVTLSVAPLAGTVEATLPIVTAHLASVDGAVEVTAFAPQPAVTSKSGNIAHVRTRSG